ncbi:MAG: RNA polymerase sigma factor [bacterium]|nr:RNA polymerase sigma factor [bacterium]
MELLRAYDAHADAIFRHCYFKTGERELAQDMTQDVFLKAWSYMQQKHQILNMRAFLYRLADNLVIDWYRKRKATSLDTLVDAGFEPADIDHKVEEQAEASLALAKLRELGEDDQKLITWRFVEDLSPREIGDILDQSENVVSVRIHRALKKLKSLLQ